MKNDRKLLKKLSEHIQILKIFLAKKSESNIATTEKIFEAEYFEIKIYTRH